MAPRGVVACGPALVWISAAESSALDTHNRNPELDAVLALVCRWPLPSGRKSPGPLPFRHSGKHCRFIDRTTKRHHCLDQYQLSRTLSDRSEKRHIRHHSTGLLDVHSRLLVLAWTRHANAFGAVISSRGRADLRVSTENIRTPGKQPSERRPWPSHSPPQLPSSYPRFRRVLGEAV